MLLIIFIIGNSQHEELNPKVAEAVHNSLMLDEREMEQNIFVAFLGLAVPQDDYITVAKQVIVNNAEKIRQTINTADYSKMQLLDDVSHYYQAGHKLIVNTQSLGKDYRLPCRKLSNFHCIADIVKQEQALNRRIADNKVLLDRYAYMVKLPFYNTYYSAPNEIFPEFIFLINLSELRMAQAVFYINNQQVTKGLKLLNEEVSFYHKLLAGMDGLVGSMIAIRQLFTLYHLIAELIDSPILANDLKSEQVKSLVRPLTITEQQVLARSLVMERNSFLYYFLTFTDKDHPFLWRILYDRDATANKVYQQFEKAIEIAQLTLPTAAPLPEKELNEPMSMKKLIKQKGLFFLRNYYGEVLSDIQKIALDTRYSNRLYDLIVYLYLVNTKLQIKQIGLKNNEITAWLANQQVVNPYTQLAIYWDAKRQCLTTDWLDRTKLSYNIWTSKQPMVHIVLQ